MRSICLLLYSVGKPRASGDDPSAHDAILGGGPVNPARAGMIPVIPHPSSSTSSKPRASGDDPVNGAVEFGQPT